MGFLVWLQDTTFSTWLRESDWALFALLIVHTIGMAFLSGAAIVLALRILGFATQVPLLQLTRFTSVMVSGLIAAIVSGTLLVVGYPAKALTNPLFYIKLLLIATAVFATRRLLAKSLTQSIDAPQSVAGNTVACLAIALWILGIAAGKFLAYTNTMLLVY